MEPPSRQPEFHDLGFAGRPIRVGGTLSAENRIGGILQENPFFAPPQEFLRELRERRARSVGTISST